jgi:chorismate-pyruvate lyase
MSHEELLALLTRARAVLGHYLFEAEDEPIRDDVAEICMAIDDALPDESRVAVKRATLERSAA